MNGFVLINKPVSVRSNDVLIQFRRYVSKLLGAKVKVGHSGTLDPAAHGLLILAVGDAVRFLRYLRKESEREICAEKTYKFQVLFGVQTNTSDLDGTITQIQPDEAKITLQQIERILPSFLGEITQVPTKFSAIKINGRKAHELARSGVEFTMPARKVFIHDLVMDGPLETMSISVKIGQKIQIEKNDTTRNYTIANFVVTSSAGLYVRTLAEDIAQKLGTIGVVTNLERVFSDGFHVSMINDAMMQLNFVYYDQQHQSQERREEKLPYAFIPLFHLSNIWPNLVLNDVQISRLLQGQRLSVYKENLEAVISELANVQYLSCLDVHGNFRGIVGLKTTQEQCILPDNEETEAKTQTGAVIFPSCMIKI